MKKIVFLLLALCLFFSCKAKPEPAPQPEPVPEPVVEEAPAPEPVVQEQPLADGEFLIVCPANMQKVDLMMAGKLDDVAEAIVTQKPTTVTFKGYTAKMNTAKEEEQAVKKAVNLIIAYLENKGVLDDVKVAVENKGANEPVASHNDIAARGMNRRVVIVLSK